MINLIKRDVIPIYSSKLYSLLKFPLIMLVCAMFFRGNDAGYLFFNIPIWIVYFIFGSSANTDLIEKRNGLFHSLPIKRWEYVLSKYISVIINYILITIYTLILLWILRFWGFDHLDYIDINTLRESFIMVLGTFSLLLPIFFMIFNERGTIGNTFILSIIVRNFEYTDSRAPINSLIQSIKSGSLMIMVLIYLISLGISIWSYNRKDLV